MCYTQDATAWTAEQSEADHRAVAPRQDADRAGAPRSPAHFQFTLTDTAELPLKPDQ
jgi:hypothetical protein